MKLSFSALVLACLAPLCARAGASLTTPIEVPLVNFSNSGQLGINVLIGTDPTPHTYLLDTGSFAFATAMGTGPSWTGASYVDSGTTFDISYGDGSLQYSGNVATATVTLSNANGDHIAAVPNATLGIITNQPYANWNTEINSDPAIAPESPATHQFFGTFGAGLDVTDSGLSSILGQMSPGSLTQGFIIQTGGINSTTPTLTIGLTPQAIASFPILIPMNPTKGNLTTSTGVTVPLYPEDQVFANYTFSDGNPSDTFTMSGNTVIDSGGLNTALQTNATISANITDGSTILPGISFTGNIGGLSGNEGLDWSFLTGNTDFTDKITLDSSGHGTLNTGITLYYQYDVMFDTQDGLVGLRPITVPEPASAGVIAGVVCFALAMGWKMRRRSKWREEIPPTKNQRRQTAKR